MFMNNESQGISFWFLMVAFLLQTYRTYNQKKVCAEFLIWKDEYMVGIEQIDIEHQKLLGLINNLLSTTICNTGEAFERQALLEVVEYTQYHFEREEALMQKYGYPDFEGHKAQHEAMVDKALDFVKAYDQKGQVALKEAAAYLQLWLLQHINGTDKKYSSFFKEKGLS